MASTGVSNLHFAFLKKDDKTGVEYDIPTPIPDLKKVGIKPKISTNKEYYDNVLKYNKSIVNEIEVELELKDIPFELWPKVLGGTITTGVYENTNNDEGEDLALGFEGLKENKKRRFVWLYKGKFALSDENYETKEDKEKWQNAKIKGLFTVRIFDNKWRAVADEDAKDIKPETIQNWFKSVFNSTAKVA